LRKVPQNVPMISTAWNFSLKESQDMNINFSCRHLQLAQASASGNYLYVIVLTGRIV
jgi:hypothetical protein